ncbi:extensin-like [Phoenix dactylifera]|uniref:Extensin-like n=1 Tax=Phoenix dactylifera TaxID=42345 RepID=A0A8B7D4F9_PHODC|nr:extensin-like [Phoenix dactylifera]
MATKVDPSSSVESRRLQSTTSMSTSSTVPASNPKVSMFGAKSGFVIPKNKLSGSLVPIFRGGGKSEGGNTVKDESTKQVQRKTKWGADVMLDAAVRKGRALAYQARLEQITQQLKSGALEIGDNQGSQSPKHTSNHDSASHKVDNESQKHELLELERREIIGEILRLNPSYKAPADYKPLLKEAKVPIPIKAYPGYNFTVLLLGPESNTQKRLEEETGAKIRVYGTKKDIGEKHEIMQSDIPEAQGAYEELYVNVSADTYEKVDAAVSLIELLLTPVSGSSAVVSTNSTSVAGDQKETSSTYIMSPVAGVPHCIPQPVLVTAQPALPQYQPNPAPWYQIMSFNAPSHPPFGLMPPPLPGNPIRFLQSPANPYRVGPLIGYTAPFGSTPRSSSAITSRPHLAMQSMPQPLNQATTPQSLPMPAQQPPPAYTLMQSQPASTAPPFSASQSMPFGAMPAPGPPRPVNPQPASMSPTVQLSNRPLTSPAPPGSSGWPTAPRFVPPTQRPSQMAPPSMTLPMRPQPAVSATPVASAPSAPNIPSNMASWPPAVIASVPSVPNKLANVPSRPPPANFAPPAVFPSRPSSSPPAFSSTTPPRGPVSTSVMVPSTSGAPLQAPMPPSAPIPPPIQSSAPRPSGMLVLAPSPMPGPPSAPQTAALVSTSTPVLAQASAPSQSLPPVTARAPVSLPSVAAGQAPRPAQPPMPSPQPRPAPPVAISGSMLSFTPVTPATCTVNASPPIAAPRPPRPVSGDFTFQPVRARVPASPPTPGPNSWSVSQASFPLGPPQAPSFRPSMQNPIPPVSTQGFPPPPSSVAPFSMNPGVIQPMARLPGFPNPNPVLSLAPATEMGSPSFSMTPQASNMSGNMSARPIHFVQPHQNPLPPANRPSSLMMPNQQLGGSHPHFVAGKISSSPGGNQFYDPFSPTSISSAPTTQGGDPTKMRSTEPDAEYEDLMSSVGVK